MSWKTILKFDLEVDDLNYKIEGIDFAFSNLIEYIQQPQWASDADVMSDPTIYVAIDKMGKVIAKEPFEVKILKEPTPDIDGEFEIMLKHPDGNILIGDGYVEQYAQSWDNFLLQTEYTEEYGGPHPDYNPNPKPWFDWGFNRNDRLNEMEIMKVIDYFVVETGLRDKPFVEQFSSRFTNQKR